LGVSRVHKVFHTEYFVTEKGREIDYVSALEELEKSVIKLLESADFQVEENPGLDETTVKAARELQEKFIEFGGFPVTSLWLNQASPLHHS
jgi:hypothetical protein